MIDSICIVRLSALGDVMMLVPLIRTLQSGLPHTQISWIISRPAYDLVEGMDGIDFIVLEKPKNLVDYWRFKRQISKRRFDVLLALQTTFRANLLYPLIKAKRKIGYDLTFRTDGHGFFVKEKISTQGCHTLDGFLKFAQHLGIQKPVIQWDLPLQAADYAWARNQLPSKGPVLIVNPAASKAERSWQAQRYIEVLKQAQTNWSFQIVLTGGPGPYDRLLADEILQAIPAIDLVGKTKPKQLLALISMAQAVLCPDTGPSHMAVAMGTPVIALHAVTNPLISGPYTCQHLVVNQYPQAVQKILGPDQKQHLWGRHVHGNEAMQLVLVEDVMEKLAQVFESIR